MPSHDGGEPTLPITCGACGKQLPAGESACPACGAAHGEGNRCPHCNSIADVEPHASLGFACLVCGGPRLPLWTDGVTQGPGTRAALSQMGREQTKHLMFSAAGWLLTGMGALGLLVATVVLLATSPGLLPSLATLLGVSVPLAAGAVSLLHAAKARKLRGEALHAARVGALGDAQAVLGPLDAERASKLLGLDAQRTELLLAEASVKTLLGEAPAPRLRVEAPRATLLDEGAEPTEATPRGARRETEI